MKTETLEKLHRILEALFILFSSILIAWTAIGSLPVHAAESSVWTLNSNPGTYHLKTNSYDESSDTYYENSYEVLFSDNYFYGLVVNLSDSYCEYHAYYFDPLSKSLKEYIVDNCVVMTQKKFNSKGDLISTGSLSYSNLRVQIFTSSTYETDLPTFSSLDGLKSYCLTGDTSGLLNGGSIDNPDFEDTAYAFTGFTANNKMTATWTGTTERSYLNDQEVEEYVRVNYYFADKEAQDTIKQADAYPDEFATADKTLTIDVSGLKPDDENWFLRYIRITPCYRQAGLGAWGDFYHGEPSYVYFNQTVALIELKLLI